MFSLRVMIPLGLGLLAGVMNFLIVRQGVAPLELVSVRQDVKAGTELTEEMLGKVTIRADRNLVKSAVPYSDRGILLQRRVTRPLLTGELVFFNDVRQEGTQDVFAQLRPGESSMTVLVKANRIAPFLRIGDPVGFLIQPQDGKAFETSGASDPRGGRRVVGPFRLIGFDERPEQMGISLASDTLRRVVVAIPLAAAGALDPAMQALDAALRADGPDRGERVLGVEYYRPTVPK